MKKISLLARHQASSSSASEKSGRKQQRSRAIQTILSSYFILLSAIIIGSCALVFSRVQYHSLRLDAISNLQHTNASIGDNIAQQISQMDTISLNTIGYSTTKDTFLEYESAADPADYQKVLLRRRLANQLTAAKGFDFSILQLNVYNMTEGGYGVGKYIGDLKSSACNQSWYSGAVSANGYLFISIPAKDRFLSGNANLDEDQKYFSVVRMFFNNAHVPLGFVEVRKSMDDVFRLAIQPESAYDLNTYIYTSDGRQLYPSHSVNDFSYYEHRSDGNGDLRNTADGQTEYVCYSETPDYGLIVATAVGHSEFLAPVYRSLAWIIGIFLLIFALCLLVSHLLSKRLSNPIRHIYHFLQRESNDSFQEIDMPDTGIREIDKLRVSLNDNIQAKKASTDAMMTLKEQEVQAQMLALQSQMNPHFLYNSLSTIAEMAEEGLTDQVSRMCTDITSILRYISSNREQQSVLEEELEQVDLYLGCMQVRFGSDLKYSFSIEDAMLDYKIPKLCIQLLVENAIKSSTLQSPPWIILVEGSVQNGSWSVTVKDNGPGFDPEVSRRLRAQMDDILATGLLPSLKIEGMGILNIFIRLYLLYGIPFIFDFGNRPEGGAFVKIGGPVNDQDQSL